jgi:hypothetical protein
MQATREGYARTHRLEEAVSFFDDPAVLHVWSVLPPPTAEQGLTAKEIEAKVGKDTAKVGQGGQDGLVEVDLLEGDHLCVAMSILSALNTC